MAAVTQVRILVTACFDKVAGYKPTIPLIKDEVAEWLRRWTANPMCSARVGSNPILVETFPGQALEGHDQKRLPLPGIEPGPPG